MTRSALASRAGGQRLERVGALHEPLPDQPFGELGDPLDLVGDGAELLVEDDLVELRRLIRERDLEILVPEEFGVRQAGGEHLLVAGDDRGGIAAVDIGDADEAVGKRSLPVRAGEIFLVHPHGELDQLARDARKASSKLPLQRHRPFGEAGIFGDQPFVRDRSSCCAGACRTPCG